MSGLTLTRLELAAMSYRNPRIVDAALTHRDAHRIQESMTHTSTATQTKRCIEIKLCNSLLQPI